MARRKYTKRRNYDYEIGESYIDNSHRVKILISTVKDKNVSPSFSKDALLNYQMFLRKHGISPDETFSPSIGMNFGVITIDQSNEKRYVGIFVEDKELQSEYCCDAVIAFDVNIAVAFKPADCPIVLVVGNDYQNKTAFAHIYAGRAELMAEIPKIAVAKMASCYNIHIKSMTAYVFPHICPYCYALEYLDPATEEKAGNFLEFSNDRYHLDLMGWLKHQLGEAGVGRIVDAYFRCTAGISPDCVSALLYKSKNFKGFFSHYRAHHESSEEGRFIVLAKILDQDFCEDE